ncbi:MAG TPA: efflux RND transporter periplasmic adaptor subunit [Verrucomicrobiae bacterium]|nr:efflux RND transporter periplasmic adaptor subunit [Verrucomicrobiae bacterium]
MNPSVPSSTPPPPVRLSRIAQAVAILVVAGLLIGYVPRWISRHRLLAEARVDSATVVDTVLPAVSKPGLGTPLPAEVEAFIQASIHARASGYLKNWFVDIGAHVTNGQVLAEIDTPELGEQLAQAKAELAEDQAALNLAKITADRWTGLLKTASVSEQETAEKQADYELKKATVDAAQANLERLQDLKSFDQVTAPFDGTITLRNTDIGQLISAGSGPELFREAQTDPLRVYVQVPQPMVHTIAPGQKVELTFLEMPGRIFPATVTRTAGAVDPASRTLQVELQVPNPRGEILAGSYGQARFTEAGDGHVLTLPDTALVFRAQGMQVAVVGNDGKVQLRSIRLGRDFGNIVEVLNGIKANDRVIINPPDAVSNGMTVQVAQPEENNLLK